MGDELLHGGDGPGPVQNVPQFPEVLLLQQRGGQPCRLRFEQSSYLDQLQSRVSLGDVGGEGEAFQQEMGLKAGDVRAVAMAGDQDPHGGQCPDGLAQGVPGQAELSGEGLLLGQPGAGREFVGDDHRLDLVDRLIRQYVFLNLIGHPNGAHRFRPGPGSVRTIRDRDRDRDRDRRSINLNAAMSHGVVIPTARGWLTGWAMTSVRGDRVSQRRLDATHDEGTPHRCASS